MSGARTCPSCAAPIAGADARFCERCGARLEPGPRDPDPHEPGSQETGPAEPGPVAAETPALAERFRALRSHPDLPGLLSHEPSTRELEGNWLGSAVFLVFFVLVGGAVTVVSLQICPPIGFIPLALVALGAFAMLGSMTRSRRASRAPLERLPARIADERTSVTGGPGAASPLTTYYVTLELEDGTRREGQVSPALAGRIARGDIGVAYLKGDHLVAFERVEV